MINTKQTRTQIRKTYETQIMKIYKKYQIQPSIITEYIYMKQENNQEAKQMLTLEVQRTQIYTNNLSYNNFTDTIQETIKDIDNELRKNKEYHKIKR